MPHFRRTICSILILALVVLDLRPVIAFAVEKEGENNSVAIGEESRVKSGIEDTDTGTAPTSQFPPFPEDKNRPLFDWSTIDWDKIVTLPSDQEEYAQKVEELSTQKRFDELSALQKKERPFFSDYVMEHYGVPQSVQTLVRQYREVVKGVSAEDKKRMKEKLAYDIKRILRAEGLLSKEEEKEKDTTVPREQIIEVGADSITPVTESKAVDPIKPEDITAEIIKTQIPKEEQSLDAATLEELEKKELPDSANGQSSFVPFLGKQISITAKEIMSFLFGLEKANAATPLIAWYEGIEDNMADFALYYLSQTQKEDGSFGTENTYELSADVALLLSEMNRTGNDQYDQLLSYLRKTTPRTTREKIIKLRLLFALKEPYQELLTEVTGAQNANGGFGIKPGYTSDVSTTLEFIWAMWGIGTDESIKKLIPALYFVVNQISEDGSLRYTPDGSVNYYLIAKTVEYFRPIWDLQLLNPDNVGVVVNVQKKIDALLTFLKKNIDVESGALKGSNDASDYAMTLRVFELYNVFPHEQELLSAKLSDFQYADGSFGHSLYATLAGLRAFRKGDLTITEVKSQGNLASRKPFTIAVTVKNQGLTAASFNQIYTFFDNVLMSETGIRNVSIECNPEKTASGEIVFVCPLDGKKEQLSKTAFKGMPVPFTTLVPGETKIINVNFPQAVGERMSGNTKLLFYLDAQEDEKPQNNWKDAEVEFLPDPDGIPAVPMYQVIQKWDINGYPAINVRWPVKDDQNRGCLTVLLREKGQKEWSQTGCLPAQYKNGAFMSWPDYPIEGKTFEFTVGSYDKNLYKIYFFSDFATINLSADPKKGLGIAKGTVTVNAQAAPNTNLWGYNVSGISDEHGSIEFKNIPHGVTVAGIDPPYYEKLFTPFEVKPDGITEDMRILTRVKPDNEPPVLDLVEIRYPRHGPAVKNQTMWSVFASGSDNTYFDHADFWYWDPHDTQWHFLQSQSMAWQQAVFDWDIPKELVGKGYKVKAVGYDYVGNASTAKEWGPFEILDGSAAVASVIVEGLEKNVWTLGEKKTVRWEIKSAVPLIEITSVRLETESVSEYIVGNSPPSLKSVEYTIPQDAYYESDSATILVSYCDKGGPPCGSARSEPFGIVDPSPAPPAPWSREKKSNFAVSTYELQRFVDSVFYNADGSKEIVYREFDKRDKNGSEVRRIVYRSLIKNQWNDPVTLVEYRYKENETDDVSFQEIKAVQGAEGSIHVVFERRVEGPPIKKDQSEIFYLHLKDGVLQKRDQISFDDTVSRAPSIAVNSQGNVFIVWLEGSSAATWNGTSTVRYREFLDGRWSDMVRLTNEYSKIPIVIEDNGSVIVVYSEAEQFFMQVKRDGQWSAQAPIVPRTIAKKELDAINKFSEVRDAVVEQDPNDPTFYRWLPSIKKKSDLEAILKNKQFDAQDKVLYVWWIKQYAQGAYAPKVFVRGNNEYDLFFREGGEKRGYIYDISYIRFGLTDVKKGEGRILAYRSIMEAPPLDDARGFSVARAQDGAYHIAYSRMWWTSGGRSKSSMYYVLFHGANLLHRTQIASSLRFVDDPRPLIFEKDDALTVYFGNSVSDLTMVNTADVKQIKQLKIQPIQPVTGSTTKGFPVELEWNVQGGNLSAYSVYLGSEYSDLKKVASGLENTSFTAEGLKSNTQYYWSVVGRQGDAEVSGGPWQFTTGVGDSKIKVSIGEKEYKDNDAIDAGKVSSGKTQDIALTFLNSGNGDLKVSDIALKGSDAFKVKGDFNGIVKAGESRTLTVQFVASDKNTDIVKTKLSFSTNDPNAPKFTFPISITIARPNIAVFRLNDNKEWKNGEKALMWDIMPLGEGRGLHFVIRNTGDDDLIFAGDKPIKISDDAEESYILYLSGDKKQLAPGEEWRFMAYVRPKTIGKKTATLSISSNDEDNGQFILTLEGEAAKPQMEITLDGQEAKGDSTFLLGETQPGETKEISFTIKNSGNYSLILWPKIQEAWKSDSTKYFGFKGRKVTSSGPNETDYETIGVSPGKSIQEVITFTAPEDLGEKIAKIVWQSNDIDKKTFTVNVNAIVEKPRLSVRTKSDSIPPTWDSPKSGDVWGIGLHAQDQVHDLTVSLSNTGNKKLTLSNIKLEGEGYSGGMIGEPFDLPPGASLTYPIIRFIAPKKPGTYRAEYSFKTNDPAVPLYSLGFEAIVWGLDMVLKNGDSEIKNGDSIDFANVPSGESKEIKVSVSNNGSNANLRLYDFTLEGSDAFAIVSKPTGVIEPGKSADIILRYSATQKPGEHVGALSFKSNDYEKEQTTFILKGVEAKPRPILVFGIDGQETGKLTPEIFPFGAVSSGSSKDLTITVKNKGTADLVLERTPELRIFTGFTLRAQPREPLKPGESGNITVRFHAPMQKGTYTAKYKWKTNDPDMPDLLLGFYATSTRSELILKNGEETMQDSATLDFGAVPYGSFKDIAVTLINNGNSDFILGDLLETKIINGANGFSLIKKPDTPIKPGEQADIVMRFNAAVKNNGSIQYRWQTNDPDHPNLTLTFTADTTWSELSMSNDGNTLEQNAILDLGVVEGGNQKGYGFSIKNNGNVKLEITPDSPSLTVQGKDVGEFIFSTTHLRRSLQPGESTDFVIVFDPKTLGKKQATITIKSNDSIAPSYAFSIKADVRAPRLDLFNGSQSISLDGSVAPIYVGRVTLQRGAPLDRNRGPMEWTFLQPYFTIKNTGDMDLVLPQNAVTLSGSGADNGDFVIIREPSSSLVGKVKPGESTMFYVRFEPKTPGDKTATLTIVSNDPLHNKIVIQLSGSSGAPRLRITSGSQLVQNHPSYPVDIDAALYPVGTPIEKTFTITNFGDDTLILDDEPFIFSFVSGDGQTNKDEFIITEKPSQLRLEPWESTNFRVRFTPKKPAGQMRRIVLTVNSNAPYVYEQPFAFTLFVLLPDIKVGQANYKDLSSGDSVNIHPTVVGGGTDAQYPIDLFNGGITDLLFPKDSVSLTGPDVDAGNFILIGAPPDRIKPQHGGTFYLSFTPKTAGAKSARLTIKSNDPDESPFTLTLQGSAVAPLLAVDYQNRVVQSGTEVNLETIEVGKKKETAFVLKNVGSQDLKLVHNSPIIAIEGQDANEFSLLKDPSSSLKPGESSEFSILFTPKSQGKKSARISIKSNDPSQETYTIVLKAEARTAPDIEVTADNTSLSSGDFLWRGSVAVGESQEIAFRVTNQGGGTLEFSNTPHISILGRNASELAFIKDLPAQLKSGESAEVIAAFRPTKEENAKEARIVINSNDPDENPFTLLLDVDAPAPHFELSRIGEPALQQNDEIYVPGIDVGRASAEVFKLSNTGYADLRLTGDVPIAIVGKDANEFRIPDPVPSILKRGKSTVFAVFFFPKSKGKKVAALSIKTNDPFFPEFRLALTSDAFQAHIELSHSGSMLSSGDSISFVSPLDVAVSQDIVIANKDLGLLMLDGHPSIKVEGINEGEFSFSQSPSSPIKSYESTKMTIRFTPKTRGVKTATLSIPSNDPDLPVYTLILRGEGIAPDLALSKDNTRLAQNEEIDFGVTDLGKKQDQAFALQNLGNTDLVFVANSPVIHITGDDQSEFILLKDIAATMQPNAAAQFTIRFIPKTPGEKNATVTLTSNDKKNSPFVVTLKARAVAPDIALLSHGAALIPSLSSYPWHTPTYVGSTSTQDFIIRNTGTADLSLEGEQLVSFEGDQKGEFRIVSQPITPIKPGEHTRFTVEFAPHEKGNRIATLTVKSNDLDEPYYTFNLKAHAFQPEIGLSHNGTPLNEGARVNFNSLLGASVSQNISITNSDEGPLLLNGNPVGAITGVNADEFAITLIADPVVHKNQPALMTIQFTPKTRGVKSATFSIASNDIDEPVRTVLLSGIGMASELNMEHDNSVLANNTSLDFGDTQARATKDLTITLTNTGTVDLNLSDITLTGDPAFSIMTQPAEPLKPGKSADFQIRFTAPSQKGEKTATLSFTTNDPDKKDVTLTFKATSKRSELSLVSGGKAVQDKDVINLGDLTTGKTKDVMFTIANMGNADLELSDIVLTGSDVFAITAQPVSRLQPGAISNIEIRFTAPTVHGDSSATLSFTTNDPDRQRVELNIRATSKRPQLVLKEGDNIVNRNTFNLGFVPTGSTKDLTLTLTNSGNADLTFDQQSTLDVFNGFSLTAQPREPLKPGASADITVRFTSPKDIKPKSQTYEWKTNDSDTPSLSLTFKATAQRSQLSVSQTTLDMGPVSVGNSKEAILTITNTGNSDLLLSNL
ncbi:choice-of-anchor D domain-containing protein, partial [Candidatus Uhrbacteria bacterium]|nr:choice-of-anchor D domain-containing protein [Candidatus Uhrbacteria bacterium]